MENKIQINKSLLRASDGSDARYMVAVGTGSMKITFIGRVYSRLAPAVVYIVHLLCVSWFRFRVMG